MIIFLDLNNNDMFFSLYDYYMLLINYLNITMINLMTSYCDVDVGIYYGGVRTMINIYR